MICHLLALFVEVFIYYSRTLIAKMLIGVRLPVLGSPTLCKSRIHIGKSCYIYYSLFVFLGNEKKDKRCLTKNMKRGYS